MVHDAHLTKVSIVFLAIKINRYIRMIITDNIWRIDRLKTGKLNYYHSKDQRFWIEYKADPYQTLLPQGIHYTAQKQIINLQAIAAISWDTRSILDACSFLWLPLYSFLKFCECILFRGILVLVSISQLTFFKLNYNYSFN